MRNKHFKFLLYFFIGIIIFLSFFICRFYTGIHYPIEIHMKSNLERKSCTYNGKFNDIKEDGFINPIIYSIKQSRLDLFINNHNVQIFDGIKSSNGDGESVYTYKLNSNGTIDELCLSTSPYIVTNFVQFNLRQFYIDNRFIDFYSKDNVQKILSENNVNDEVKNIILLNLAYDTNNINTLIAWIMCENDNYFLSWDKCRNSVVRFKNKSMKSYFQSDDYNYFTFYNDDEFCNEFRTKEGQFVDNNNLEIILMCI